MENKIKVYLSGPMTGLPEKNFPAFHKLERRLKKKGFDICNPATLDQEPGHPHEWYMRNDLEALVQCQAITLLPGWQDSLGARTELVVARAVGLKLISAKTLEPIQYPFDLPSIVFNFQRKGL